MGEAMRLQKFLSRAGVASRRDSEELIAAGRVRVDGTVVTELGSRVEPGNSVVEVDGERVEPASPRWVALNKPPAVITSRGDPEGRTTIYDLLPDGPVQDLFHVGRLDYMSEGLLLLTNQGDVAHALLHPSREVSKRYEVGLAEEAAADLPRRLLEGVRLEDGPARADAASLLPDAREGSVLLITLHEGRNREIRRMLDRLGVRIRYLRRLSFGPVELRESEPGAWRDLDPGEVRALREAAGLTREGSEGGGRARRSEQEERGEEGTTG